MKSQKQKNIIYRIVEPKDREAVLEVLTQSFLHEPSTAGCAVGSPDEAQWRRLIDFFMDECVCNNLSVIAVDKMTGRCVGAFINRDFLRPLPEGFMEFVNDPSPFAPVVQVLVQIDEAWFEQHPEITSGDTGRVADLWMLGVHPDFAGHGIASRLAGLSLECVTQAGFEYAVIECTGAYSQKIMETYGCTAVYELPYTDLLWKGQAVFQNVPAPHSKWVIYEKQLVKAASVPASTG